MGMFDDDKGPAPLYGVWPEAAVRQMLTAGLELVRQRPGFQKSYWEGGDYKVKSLLEDLRYPGYEWEKVPLDQIASGIAHRDPETFLALANEQLGLELPHVQFNGIGMAALQNMEWKWRKPGEQCSIHLDLLEGRFHGRGIHLQNVFVWEVKDTLRGNSIVAEIPTSVPGLQVWLFADTPYSELREDYERRQARLTHGFDLRSEVQSRMVNFTGDTGYGSRRAPAKRDFLGIELQFPKPSLENLNLDLNGLLGVKAKASSEEGGGDEVITRADCIVQTVDMDTKGGRFKVATAAYTTRSPSASGIPQIQGSYIMGLYFHGKMVGAAHFGGYAYTFPEWDEVFGETAETTEE